MRGRRKGSRLRRLAAGLLGLVLAAVPVPAMADQTPLAVLNALGLPVPGETDPVRRLQTDLSWIGLYRGQMTGRMDLDTRRAVTAFQEGLQEFPTGQLDQTQREILRQRAAATLRRANIVTEREDWTGMRFRVPRNYFDPPELSGKEKLNLAYRGRDAASTAMILQRYLTGASASDWLQEIRRWAKEGGYQVLIDGLSGQFVYMVAEHAERDMRAYMVYQADGREIRGVDITFSRADIQSMRPLVAEILASFEFMAAPGVAPGRVGQRIRDGTDPASVGQPVWMRRMVGNGSGSIVSSRGHVITNHHVVVRCGRITVNGTEAFLVGSDNLLDLALLVVPDLAGRDPVRFAPDTARLGTEVLVLGYPVFSISPSMNMTNGIVSGMVGYRGDRTRFQITAAVQPGNSGGPVIGMDGSQIAVVASKPSAAAQAESNIENIGWVIRAREAVEFLRRYDVDPLIARPGRPRAITSLADQTRDFRRIAVRVECQGGGP